MQNINPKMSIPMLQTLKGSIGRRSPGFPPPPTPPRWGGEQVAIRSLWKHVPAKNDLISVCAALMTFFCVSSALAQEAPILANASAAEKARLQPLIEGATKEGQIAYIETIIQPGTNDVLADAFRVRYGLPRTFKVLNTTMAPGNLITRLQQEMQAGKLTFDVGAISSIPWVMARVNEGKIAKYPSPEYAAYKKVFEMGLGKDGYFAFNCGYYFVPMWNTETLKFEGNSYWDLLKAAPAGRYTGSDVAVSDPPLMTYMALRTILPLDYWKEFAALKPNFVYKSEVTAQRLVAGEDLMAQNGMPTRAHQVNSRGAKLKYMDPKEGIVLLSQSTFILEGAPHPNAARLWIDFVLSEEGQKILALKEYTISGRGGFKSPTDLVPTLESLKIIPFDWTKATEADMQKARDEWSSVFRK